MTSTRQQLEKLLAHHEGIAAAIRTTLSLLEGHEERGAKRRAPQVITQALALDAARAAANGNGHHERQEPRPTKPKLTMARIRANRRRTARILGRLSKTEPRPLGPGEYKQVAVMLRHGYITKKGDGYLRTGKEFEVEKPSAR